MKFLIKLILVLALLFPFSSLPVFAQDQISIPNVTPLYIKRYSYINESQGGFSKSKTGAAKDAATQTGGINSNALLTSVGGVISVVGGSVFTWLKLRGNKKAFKDYLTNIDKTAESVLRKLDNKGKDKIKELEEELTKIQESAELSAANKKIDENQLTAITNHIKRKIDESRQTG